MTKTVKRTKKVLSIRHSTSCAFVLVFLVLFSSLVMIARADATAIAVTPASLTVSAGSSFNMTVNCSPARPVKAFELKVSFDPSLLHANNVTEGDIFHGYATFFHNGTIDNQAGTIVNVYDLIIGPGIVINNGSFVTLAFTAGPYSGSSPVTLYGVHVTNETEYINVSLGSASVTVTGGTAPPSPPPPSGPPMIPPTGNQPPSSPMKPVGPALVEVGATYAYNSSAWDPEGGRVRLRFDWGDGTLSNWSGLVASNASVSFSHRWSNVSSYRVRAIAQDEAGLNSSWSEPLNVTVSQAMTGNQSPVASFLLPPNVTSNQTALFDASGSTSLDGVIVSYVWDFGDGTQGTGMAPTHKYSAPGQYLVTLSVTNDQGLTSVVSQTVTVAFASEPGTKAVTPVSAWSYGPWLALAGVLGALFVCVVLFREPLRAFLFRRTPVATSGLAGSSDAGPDEIMELLDALFLDMKQHAVPLSKNSLLDTYCDFILEHVAVRADAHLPALSLVEVERIVDETYHLRILEKIDKM
jgi:hypothetical protein